MAIKDIHKVLKTWKQDELGIPTISATHALISGVFAKMICLGTDELEEIGDVCKGEITSEQLKKIHKRVCLGIYGTETDVALRKKKFGKISKPIILAHMLGHSLLETPELLTDVKSGKDLLGLAGIRMIGRNNISGALEAKLQMLDTKTSSLGENVATGVCAMLKYSVSVNESTYHALAGALV